MTSPLASNPLGLANPLFKLEYPQSIGVYTTYGDAQKAVAEHNAIYDSIRFGKAVKYVPACEQEGKTS